MEQRLSRIDPSDAEALHLLAGLKGKSVIGKEDVAALRASESMLGLLSFDAAAAIVAIERGPAKKCREWSDFMIEALLDFVVWGERPSGVVTDQQASWLLAELGETPTPACMALLVSVLEEAHTVPGWFAPAVRVRATAALETHGRHAA